MDILEGTRSRNCKDRARLVEAARAVLRPSQSFHPLSGTSVYLGRVSALYRVFAYLVHARAYFHRLTLRLVCQDNSVSYQLRCILKPGFPAHSLLALSSIFRDCAKLV